jgi:hypothetical protein
MFIKAPFRKLMYEKREREKMIDRHSIFKVPLHQVKNLKCLNKVHSIMMGATSGAGTAYPSEHLSSPQVF